MDVIFPRRKVFVSYWREGNQFGFKEDFPDGDELISYRTEEDVPEYIAFLRQFYEVIDLGEKIMDKTKENPIIVALDGKSYEETMVIAELLSSHVWGYKVNDLFFERGLSIVDDLQHFGNVMLDAKLHDIPNTVDNTAERFAKEGAVIVTVHATGGVRMVQAAVKHLPGKVAAVTCLTSLSDAECARSYARSPSGVVTELAKVAKEGGAEFVVCSSKELSLACFDSKYEWAFTGKKIVPGIRPKWYTEENTKKDDQRRVTTPVEAVEAGADLLVIGRPILQSDDPVAAATRTWEEIIKG